jgi:alpha-tubulin suppressor-like RCC1 family protein
MRTLHALALSCLTAAIAACSDTSAPETPSDPIDLPDPPQPTLALGSGHVCQVSGGAAACWGDGSVGQLGNGGGSSPDQAVTVGGSHNFVSIVAGASHTCALDADGVAWCWGVNAQGQLGTGTLADAQCGAFPCQTVPAPVATDAHFQQLTAGRDFTCGLTTSGSVLCWGANDARQLGTNSVEDSCEGLLCSHSPVAAAVGKTFVAIGSSLNFTCAIASTGVVSCWGLNPNNHHFTDEPVVVDEARIFGRVAGGGLHSCALDLDGAAWCWGIDALGAGSATLESAKPVPVTGGHTFTALASGRYSSCGVDQDGGAWCWGDNTDGATGNEPVTTGTRFDDPVRVSGDFHFESIAAGTTTYCGVTTSGSTICWGRGDEGQLLNGGKSSAEPVVVE